MPDGPRTLLADVLGPDARVEADVSGDGGAGTWHVVSPRDGDLVVKTAPVGAPGLDLARSSAALQAALAVGVPVPGLLAAGARDGWQYQVCERVDGRRWSDVAPTLDPPGRAGVLDALADVLARLRTARYPAFGDLGEPARTELDALRTRSLARTAPGPRRTAVERLLDRHGHLFDGTGPAVLVHGDLHHANTLVRPTATGWELAAVLDWDSAWAGPADADAARAALWDDMPGTPDAPGPRAAVQQLLWCLEYPAETERHRSDTARLAALLGVPLPA
ncbi:phosphotransferase family protein [Cellulomonas endometrii]|uniref:phosphotransferase family protein n=1 Tax=Cellulomonas endometrii TaxID=3036301 RepID=UPI0024AE19CB|nr:phosphotransferase [Cellulomonas endometrii]